MKQLFQVQKRLIEDLSNIYFRNIYQKFKSSHRILSIVGERGGGKTTYMLQYIKENYGGSERALYISADNLYFVDNSLVETAEKFVNEYAGELLCIDEIHRYDNWAQELKNIYDTYPNLKILFTGSSAIDLINQKFDLSRRAVLRKMPGFSFREYLEYKLKDDYPILTLDDLKSEDKKRLNFDKKGILGHFKQYLKTGYYPLSFQLENDIEVYEAINGVIDKVINSDIISYYNLKTSTLPIFQKILYFVHTSVPGEININKIAKSLNKDHSDVARYIQILRDSGLLQFLMIDKSGHALIRNAEKFMLNNSNLSYAIGHFTGKENNIGSIREIFVNNQLKNADLKPFYSKEVDIICENIYLEVGGKSKKFNQIKGMDNAFLVKDDILYRSKGVIPLYLFGFLY